MVSIRRANPKDEARVIELLKQFPEGDITVDWGSAAAAFRESPPQLPLLS